MVIATYVCTTCMHLATCSTLTIVLSDYDYE